MRFVTTAFALLFAASPAVADEVLLRSGHKVVGIEREEKDRIVVETGWGTVSFPREEVVSVTKGETPLHAWPVRYAEIEKSTKASDFTKLAAWARENGMPRYVGGLWRRALELDPENEEARKGLGFVRHEGRWVTVQEHRKQQGQVQDGGKWVLPLEKELAERRRLESESLKLDRTSERKRREDQRRRAREEADLQTRLQAVERAPSPFDMPDWYRRGHHRWALWGSAYDLAVVDWILTFRNLQGVAPTTSQQMPRPPILSGQAVDPVPPASMPSGGFGP